MAARRKPMELVNPATVPLNLDGFQDTARAAIEKDLRLLQAALASDGVIVTRDDRLRTALAGTPDGIALSGKIKWFNPVADDLEVLKSL
ncbi:MAG: hypothetical protein HY674_04675 [Chloroflexi bacterium]|nr:hypothetical protein [Chloroflexota bacterium]